MTAQTSKRSAVFLDLQGTLGGEGLEDILDFSFYPFSVRAIKLLNENSLLVIVVTNQSHISKGYFTYEQFEEKIGGLKRELTEHEAKLDGVYCCPHRPDGDCNCCKPKPGLLLEAKKDFNLDLNKCYVVGDSGPSDIGLAQAVGARGILVMTGLGHYCRIIDRQLWKGIMTDYMALDVLEAVKWISDKEREVL